MTDHITRLKEAYRAAIESPSISNSHKFRELISDSRVIGSLLERLEEAEKDAARYRWLRSRVPGSAYRIAGVIYSEGSSGVDAAIDAAIASQEGDQNG